MYKNCAKIIQSCFFICFFFCSDKECSQENGNFSLGNATSDDFAENEKEKQKKSKNKKSKKLNKNKNRRENKNKKKNETTKKHSRRKKRLPNWYAMSDTESSERNSSAADESENDQRYVKMCCFTMYKTAQEF